MDDHLNITEVSLNDKVVGVVIDIVIDCPVDREESKNWNELNMLLDISSDPNCFTYKFASPFTPVFDKNFELVIVTYLASRYKW